MEIIRFKFKRIKNNTFIIYILYLLIPNIRNYVEGVIRLMNSEFKEPVNIGSEEMVTINQLAEMAIQLSGKNLTIKHLDVPHTGVRGRNSVNALIKEKLGWEPEYSFETLVEEMVEQDCK